MNRIHHYRYSGCNNHSASHAFTLLEVLVVISIIGILASMVIGLGGPLRRNAMVQSERAAVTILYKSLTEAGQREGAVNPVVHPAAATVTSNNEDDHSYKRSLFVRQLGSSVLSKNAESYSLPAAQEQEALVEARKPDGNLDQKLNNWLLQAPSRADGAILPSDRFVGLNAQGDIPSLHFCSRRMLQIIGPADRSVVGWRLLPGLGINWDEDDVFIKDVFDEDVGADFLYRPKVADTSWEQRAVKKLRSVLGNTLAEMRDLNIYQEVGSDFDSTAGGADERLSSDKRLYLPPDLEADYDTENDSAPARWTDGDADERVTYRLRGAGLYAPNRVYDGGSDTNGVELLVWRQSNGQLAVMSAGLDGYFVVKPGDDNVFNAKDELDPLDEWIEDSGDEDAREDNIILGADR